MTGTRPTRTPCSRPPSTRPSSTRPRGRLAIASLLATLLIACTHATASAAPADALAQYATPITAGVGTILLVVIVGAFAVVALARAGIAASALQQQLSRVVVLLAIFALISTSASAQAATGGDTVTPFIVAIVKIFVTVVLAIAGSVLFVALVKTGMQFGYAERPPIMKAVWCVVGIVLCAGAGIAINTFSSVGGGQSISAPTGSFG